MRYKIRRQRPKDSPAHTPNSLGIDAGHELLLLLGTVHTYTYIVYTDIGGGARVTVNNGFVARLVHG